MFGVLLADAKLRKVKTRRQVGIPRTAIQEEQEVIGKWSCAAWTFCIGTHGNEMQWTHLMNSTQFTIHLYSPLFTTFNSSNPSFKASEQPDRGRRWLPAESWAHGKDFGGAPVWSRKCLEKRLRRKTLEGDLLRKTYLKRVEKKD